MSWADFCDNKLILALNQPLTQVSNYFGACAKACTLWGDAGGTVTLHLLVGSVPPGTTVGFYFLWLEFYTGSLVMPALLGMCVTDYAACAVIEGRVVASPDGWHGVPQQVCLRS